MKLFATAAFSTILAVAFGQNPPPPQPDFTALKTATGITDAQITQLQTLQRDERTEVQTIVTQLQTAEKNFQTAVTAANPVAATVGQLAIQVQNLRKQIGTIHESYRSRALAAVTADVKAKIDQLAAAAKLRDAIQEGTMLNLLTPPDPPAGPGPGPNFAGPRGPGGPQPAGFGPPPMGMGFRPRQ